MSNDHARLGLRRLARKALPLLIACLALYAPEAATGSPDALPRLFPAETAWPAGTDIAPAFRPDGRTVFFTHAAGSARTIMVAHRTLQGWSSPEPAPFSGIWRDIEPVMSPDGRYLLFISNRPTEPGAAPLDGFFGGQVQPGAGGNLWRVDRVANGWGRPRRLPQVINSNSAIYSPAVSADGSVYFNQPDPITHRSHIYRAQARGSTFLPPKPLSISNGTIADYDAAVAPDQSFIVFSSGRAPAAKDSSILFVIFRRGHGWTTPQPLAGPIEGLEARLGPGGRTLYFSADPAGTGHARIYEIPTADYIPAARPTS